MEECKSNCKWFTVIGGQDTNKRMMRLGNAQVMKDSVCLNNRKCAPYPTEDMELLKNSKPHTKTISMARVGRGGGGDGLEIGMRGDRETKK